MANTPNDLDEDLRKELECPVCSEFMKPPISMCENGHSICSNCKPKLDKCPSCRRPLLQVRNRALESLSAMFVNTNSTPKNSQSAAKIYKCPFSTISREDCVWDGSLQDMKNHIKTSHTCRSDTDRSNRRFNVVLADLSPNRHYRTAVCVVDEFFYVVWEIKDGSFFCAVLYVGPKKKSSKFTYKFSLTSENGMKNISMLFQTQSVVQNTEKFFTPGDCVLLHYDTVMKFLNSEKCLHCAFEISPIETLSGDDRNLSQHGASSDVKCGRDFFTDERDILEQEVKRELMASHDNMSDGSHRHHADVYRNGRGGKQGRGGGRGRFSRAGRRVGERPIETQANCESGVRNVKHRSRSLGRYAKLGRSLTDLRDEALYEGEDKDTLPVGQLRDIPHANRLILNPSSSSSAVKLEKTDELTSVSGLGKSQGKAEANKHKVKPSGLPTAKYAPKEHLTKVSAVGKSQGNFQESVPTVISFPSLSSVKCAPSEPAPTHKRTEVKPQVNDSIVKSPSSEKATDGKVVGESQGNFQASGPALKSFGLPPASSVNVTTASTFSKAHDKAEAIYPKLDFVDLDDHRFTAVSPFDTLYDIVKASVARGNAPTNVSTVSNIPSQQSTNVSSDVSLRNNQPHAVTASEETWKCPLCGYLVPVKRTNQYYQLVDIAPPGTNWKCKLCDQWRP